MNEESHPPEPARLEAASDAPVSKAVFPSEPFACPTCGQMLAAACRVCVACRQPIDPARIAAAPAQVLAHRPGEAPAAPASVRFPWVLFFALLLMRIAAAGFAQRRWGILKAELVLGGVEMVCAAWVFYDAHRVGAPRPLRWALGTLFLWPIVFPWYVVRRKAPRAVCPFVEGMGLPVVLLVIVALGVVITLVRGPLK